MTPWHCALLALLLAPWVIALLRVSPAALRLTTLVVAALPFGIPHFRFITAVLATVMVIKMLQAAARHEQPPGYLDFVLFLCLPVVARWEIRGRADISRAVRSVLRGVALIAVGLVVARTTTELKAWPVAFVVLFQIELYLMAAGGFNILVAPLALRGIDYTDPFRSPFLAKSPAEFWGWRWNTWVNHLLHRYVFLPVGGKRRASLGVFAAFAVSGIAHEAIFGFIAWNVTGWILAYFLTQAALVMLTSRWRAFRTLTRRAPAVAWALTMIAMLATGSLFVHGVKLALMPISPMH